MLELSPNGECLFFLGKVAKKKPEKVWSFAKPGGGPEVYINNQPPSAIMCFFNRACKTILGPPKHVLHLEWSVYVTFKTIKIALKVEL